MTRRQNRNQNNSSNSHYVCLVTQCYVIWNVWNKLLSPNERNNKIFTLNFDWVNYRYSISVSITGMATREPSITWVNNSWIVNEMLFTVLWLRTPCPRMLQYPWSMHVCTYIHIQPKSTCLWLTTPISRLLSVKLNHISGYSANEYFMNSYSIVFQPLWMKCCIMLCD